MITLPRIKLTLAALTISLLPFTGVAASQTASAATTATTTHASVGTSSPALNLDLSTKKPNDYWQAAVARFRSEESTAPKEGIVLIGDSITNRWPAGMFPGEKVVGRGIGGDHIGGWNYLGLIDRLDTSIEVLQPKKVFLMIGINDMLDNGPPMENMIISYGYLLDQLKKAAPDAQIIVQSILPVSKPAFHYMHEPIKVLNKEIKRMAEERGLKYVDLYSHFIDENGKLRKGLDSDGIHLSKAGYELWLKVLKDEGLID